MTRQQLSLLVFYQNIFGYPTLTSGSGTVIHLEFQKKFTLKTEPYSCQTTVCLLVYFSSLVYTKCNSPIFHISQFCFLPKKFSSVVEQTLSHMNKILCQTFNIITPLISLLGTSRFLQDPGGGGGANATPKLLLTVPQPRNSMLLLCLLTNPNL